MLREHLPQIQYDPISQIIKLEKEKKERSGLIAVCTAGTADIPVAEEAAQTAEYFGAKVERCIGRSGGQASDRSPHFCRLWGKYAWAFRPFDDDQFLRQWYSNCEYR